MNANDAREIADSITLAENTEYFNRVILGMIRDAAQKGRYYVLTSKLDIIQDSYVEKLRKLGYSVHKISSADFLQYKISWNHK